ncbi:hypothetical protein [Aurantibacter aestuarii]|uniref:Uncharacterized protein n=1 Tax=Aurantibacter aestuarii TaxID=1266046 RepID=A0A2T1NEP0_9FLAO|nr:hypothetical protein [Aurantibacter aestuarii]PSG90869.1 hypothetical protein C7H52_06240 [Aurantibacter aestuarii]
MKNILIISALTVSGVYFLAKNKVSRVINDYKLALNNLTYNLNKLSNLGFNSQLIRGKVSLNITNNSALDLVLKTAGKITLTRLDFYTPKGLYIGYATPNLSEIEILANSTYTTPEIDFNVPLTSVSIKVITELFSNYQNIQIKPTINALGKNYTF